MIQKRYLNSNSLAIKRVVFCGVCRMLISQGLPPSDSMFILASFSVFVSDAGKVICRIQ